MTQLDLHRWNNLSVYIALTQYTMSIECIWHSRNMHIFQGIKQKKQKENWEGQLIKYYLYICVSKYNQQLPILSCDD